MHVMCGIGIVERAKPPLDNERKRRETERKPISEHVSLGDSQPTCRTRTAREEAFFRLLRRRGVHAVHRFVRASAQSVQTGRPVYSVRRI